MRTIGVLAFISLYRCVESANRGSGSAIDPSTWTEEELLWFPFNAILVALMGRTAPKGWPTADLHQ